MLEESKINIIQYKDENEKMKEIHNKELESLKIMIINNENMRKQQANEYENKISEQLIQCEEVSEARAKAYNVQKNEFNNNSD